MPLSNTLKVQTHWNTLSQTLSLTQTSLHPLKVTLKLTHSSKSLSLKLSKSLTLTPKSVTQIVSSLSTAPIDPPCRRYSLSLLNTLSFLLLRFLSLSLSLSNFRFWNFMMLPRVFRFSIWNLFGFWGFMFGFREKKIEVLGRKWSFVILVKNVYYLVWLFGKWVNKKMIFFLTNWAFELLLWN